MKQMKFWKLWMLIAILTVNGTMTLSLTSCSNDDNALEVKVLTPEEEELKAYINAANARENVSEAELKSTYAPFDEWRADAPDSEDALFNLRFTTNTFNHESENAKELPDPSYEPSRDGLDGLTLSGSGRPNKTQLTALAKTLKEKAGSKPVYIVDLRAEMHGIINGHHLSRYGYQNWGTIGMQKEQIIKEETELIHSLKGQKITYAKIGSSTNYQPQNPKEEEVSEALTEEEAVEGLGMNYYRITALDHVFQTDATLNSFFEFYRSLSDSDVWIHFHCQAGRGRTTFFMMMVDMIENPSISMKDIIYRQALIGGTSMYNDGSTQSGSSAWRASLFKEISVMVPIVYQYIQENEKNNFSVKWSEWKIVKYGYLM